MQARSFLRFAALATLIAFALVGLSRTVRWLAEVIREEPPPVTAPAPESQR